MFNIYDENDNIVACEAIHMFSQDGKNYIVYADDCGDILASFYKEENDKIIIYKITDDKDFDIVDKELERINI